MTVDGLAFRVFSTPSENPAGPPFVLIHGIGTSHRYFARLHSSLSAYGDVHSIDLPGFGGLPAPVGDADVPRMAAALSAVLDRLRVHHAVLVGHSMGAQWVVEASRLRPELATAVVVIGAVTDSDRRTLIMQALLLARDCLREPASVGAVVMGDYLRCSPIWYAKQARYMLRYRIEERVADLAVPLLIIRGGDDPIARQEWCSRLRDNAAAATMTVIPGHRHLVQYTAATAVATTIRLFLRDNAINEA